MTPDQIIEVVEAFKNKEEIEIEHKDNLGFWCIIGKPLWDFGAKNYRVKRKAPFIKGEPVLVTNTPLSELHRRYFSHKEGNKFICFDYGQTAWSNDGNLANWNYCRRPTKEELECE